MSTPIGGSVSGWIETAFPLRVASEPNTRGHWAKRHRRAGNQHDVVGLQLLAVRVGVELLVGRPLAVPVTVTLTLQGPKELDGDNLQAGLKAVRDAVARFLGVDDADRRVAWAYGQEPARRRGVRIRIERRA